MSENVVIAGSNEEVIGEAVMERQANLGKKVSKNDSYLASNPEKKSKSKGGAGHQSTVLASMEGQVTNTLSYKALVAGGNHSAIRIQKQHDILSEQVPVCGRKRTCAILKGGLGVCGSSLKGRRTVEYRRIHNVGTSNFINNLNGELDKIIEAPGDGDNTVYMLSDNDASWSDFQLDDMGDPGGNSSTGDRGAQ
ncbi:hypothetical protein V6N13_124478 [Hibiscus sabdariffa]|uniref:Uncharacterized protein n=1 Tax=Hibiscus sabdariffa TaxID=183260 RepID=A0ABR2S2B0_9ROSI